MKRQYDEDDEQTITVQPLLITMAQAASLCQVGMDRMREWSFEPGFPVIRTTQQVRIHRTLLDEWLKQRALRGED